MLTDYLEEALEGLEGLIKQLRRETPGPAEEEKNVQNSAGIGKKVQDYFNKNRNVFEVENEVYSPGAAINRDTRQVYNPEKHEISQSEAASPGEESISGADIRQTEPAEGLDGGGRAWDSAFSPLSGSSAAEWAAGTETGMTRETAGYAPVPALPPAAGEAGWAEQADRAFRRDSRRYDGGFYLY